MFSSKEIPSAAPVSGTRVCIVGDTAPGLYLAYILQKKGCAVTILTSPSHQNEFSGSDILFKETRLLQNQRATFSFIHEIKDEPEILIIAAEFPASLIPLLSPSRLKNALILNFSPAISSETVRDIVKTPVIDAYFWGFINRDKNHITIYGSEPTITLTMDETSVEAFRIKDLFEETKTTIKISDNAFLNFWNFFGPFIIANLLSAARNKNFYNVCKNDNERLLISDCAEEISALAATQNVRIETSEILIRLYNIPSGYILPLQTTARIKTLDMLSAKLASVTDSRTNAPKIHALLREIYNNTGITSQSRLK